MKKPALILLPFLLLIISCNTSKSISKSTNSIEGTWSLNYISGSKLSFKELYPSQVPTITFNLKENQFSGGNSCNRYSGKLDINKNNINFKESKIIATLMVCEGDGDNVFMSALNKIDSYSISKDDKTLNFKMGEIAIMSFERK